MKDETLFKTLLRDVDGVELKKDVVVEFNEGGYHYVRCGGETLEASPYVTDIIATLVNHELLNY